MSRTVLLYRETCLKCRIFSALLICAALGTVQRIGLGTDAGQSAAKALGISTGKLVLVEARTIAVGKTAMYLALATPWRMLITAARHGFEQNH